MPFDTGVIVWPVIQHAVRRMAISTRIVTMVVMRIRFMGHLETRFYTKKYGSSYEILMVRD